MTQPPTKCASCRHFPRAALQSPEPIQCDYRELNVSWDHRACVLYSYADRAETDARRPLVAALMSTK